MNNTPEPKTYTIEITGDEVRQIYNFFKMSWGPQDIDSTNKPAPLEEKITNLWKQIESEIKSKTCQTCWHYKAGYGCNLHQWYFPPTHSACASYIDK